MERTQELVNGLFRVNSIKIQAKNKKNTKRIKKIIKKKGLIRGKKINSEKLLKKIIKLKNEINEKILKLDMNKDHFTSVIINNINNTKVNEKFTLKISLKKLFKIRIKFEKISGENNDDSLEEIDPILTEEETENILNEGLEIIENHIKEVKQETQENIEAKLRKLNKETVEKIYLEAGIIGASYQKVADNYGVSKSTVFRIVHKKLPVYLKIIKEFDDKMNYTSENENEKGE
jgi:DNA invertase Pin-like site-specific DNA recombinase